jgi:hypothetical protein
VRIRIGIGNRNENKHENKGTRRRITKRGRVNGLEEEQQNHNKDESSVQQKCL